MTNPRIPQSIEQSIAAKQAILDNPDFQSRIQQAAEMITASLRDGGKIHFCGNGGSAADLGLLRGTAKAGDVIVGISTSGNSKNILNAFEVAKEMGVKIIAMTGETGGKMKDFADILLNAASQDTPRIQESHIMIGHIICELVESEMFGR